MNRIKSTLTALLLAGSFQASAADQTILNSSYDIARELFVAYNLCLLSIGNKKQGRRSKLNSRTLDHRLKRVLFCKA